LQLTLEPSEQLLQSRDGLLCLIRPRRIDFGPLDGLLDLMDGLFQALSLAIKVNLHVSTVWKHTYFFTPFCLPRLWLGTTQSASAWRHFSHRAWPAGRLQRILLRRQFRHAGCFAGPVVFPCPSIGASESIQLLPRIVARDSVIA
jgi:hypothetical protein